MGLAEGKCVGNLVGSLVGEREGFFVGSVVGLEVPQVQTLAHSSVTPLSQIKDGSVYAVEQTPETSQV